MQSEVVSVRESGSSGGGRREDGKKRKVGGGKVGKKEALPTPVFFETEFPQQCQDNPTHFKHIAGLHSELVAIDTEGALWRWAWQAAAVEPHPLVIELGLAGERVKLLAGRQLRLSVVMESGKVGWLRSLCLLCVCSTVCVCVCVCVCVGC